MNTSIDYAIVKTSGRQFRVSVGDRVRVDRMSQEPGSKVVLDQVLILSTKGKVSVGAPVVSGAVVEARVDGHGLADKVIVFKYKSKVRYRRKTGHRQRYTELTIEKITARKGGGRKASTTKSGGESEAK